VSNRTPEEFVADLERARAGDRRAIERLLMAHRDRLRQLAERLVSPHLARDSDPLDILQETLLIASREIVSFRGEDDATLGKWLGTILHNKVRERVRHQARRPDFLPPTGDSEEPWDVPDELQTSVTRRFTRRHDLALLEQALEMLEPSDRELMQVKYLDPQGGVTFVELADRFGDSPQNLRKRTSRLRITLARGIELLEAMEAREVPDDCRQLLCWKHFRNWSLEKMSQQLGWNPQQVKARYQEGIRYMERSRKPTE
jgi:RNA polymerase sigma factor (sigma-70 family)